ncbi:MAG: hypothetical protein Q9172_007348 [Xanthocarpia lactea]
MPIDFLVPEIIIKIFDKAVTRLHRLDIVVSAVSNGYYPHISQITPEALDWAFAANPRAQLCIAQQAYKHVTFDFGPKGITVNAIAASGIKHEEGYPQARAYVPSADSKSDDDLKEVSQARKVPGCIRS